MAGSRLAILEGWGGFGAARGKRRGKRKSSGRGNTPQARKFGAAARYCWAEVKKMAAAGKVSGSLPKAAGSCIRRELKKRR